MITATRMTRPKFRCSEKVEVRRHRLARSRAPEGSPEKDGLVSIQEDRLRTTGAVSTTTPTIHAGAGAGAGAIVIASVPSAHVYVEHLSPLGPGPAEVTRLPDPDPLRPDQPAGAVWWPPAALSKGWVERNHSRFDIFHLHFGFDATSVADLKTVLAALRRHGKPLVYTVHDLRNPHHEKPGQHDRQLGVLIPVADALVTLTPGAAREIQERWGRTAVVVPHPHVVGLDLMETWPPRARSEAFRVGVHVKSLRSSMEPLPVLEVLRSIVDRLPGAVLQVDGHRDVLEPSGDRYDARLSSSLNRWQEAGQIDLRIHDFFSDLELWRYLRSLDVSVLPYRFGTHSGWLEACRDLGTMVLAPDCGYYADQAPIIGYHHDEHGLDEESLALAISTAYYERPSFNISASRRRVQRNEIARAHHDLYRSLIS